MHDSQLFDKIIIRVQQSEDVEVRVKVYIERALTYFKNQSLCEADRRDSEKKILDCWREFEKITKNAKILSSFRNDLNFWQKVESAVGIYHPKPPVVPAPRPPIKMHDFFCSLGHDVQKLEKTPANFLILFGLWFLESQATQSGVFRSHERCEKVYRMIHPFLQKRGLLEPYKGNERLRKDLKHFLTGKSF